MAVPRKTNQPIFNAPSGPVRTLVHLSVAASLAAREAARYPVPSSLTSTRKAAPMDDMSDASARPDSYRVTADELRQFIERYERLEAEKKDIADQQKEVMAEAKSRGYDTKVLRKVVALRKRDRDEIAEEEAVLELYKEALGM